MGERSDTGPEQSGPLTGLILNFPRLGAVELGILLGAGTYGDVYLTQTPCPPTKYAIKFYREEPVNMAEDGVSYTTIRELSAVKRIGSHPNIVALRDLYVDYSEDLAQRLQTRQHAGTNQTNYKKTLAFVLAAYEYCEGGDLGKRLREIRQANPTCIDSWGVPLGEAKMLAFQILNGLAYIHAEKMNHRDMKPENLMLHHNVLKLGDLGLCRALRWETDELTSTVCTMYYRPLEVLFGRLYARDREEPGQENIPAEAPSHQSDRPPDMYGDGVVPYGLSLDIWSAGCIIGELVLGKPLFKGGQEFDLFVRITQLLGPPTEDVWQGCTMMEHHPYRPKRGLQFPHGDPRKRLHTYLRGKMDTDGLDLLMRMLQYSPKKRINAAEALCHPWFSDIRFPALDRLGVHCWCYDIFQFRLGKDIVANIQNRDPLCLKTTELAHHLCRGDLHSGCACRGIEAESELCAVERLDALLREAYAAIDAAPSPTRTCDGPIHDKTRYPQSSAPAAYSSFTAPLLSFAHNIITGFGAMGDPDAKFGSGGFRRTQ